MVKKLYHGSSKMIEKMNKAELQEALLELLAKSPGSLHLRFAHDYTEAGDLYF